MNIHNDQIRHFQNDPQHKLDAPCLALKTFCEKITVQQSKTSDSPQILLAPLVELFRNGQDITRPLISRMILSVLMLLHIFELFKDTG